MLDIDKFKEINDKYGHASGDKAVKILVDQLRKTIQSDRYLCRWGGDKFTGMLDEDLETTEKVLDR